MHKVHCISFQNNASLESIGSNLEVTMQNAALQFVLVSFVQVFAAVQISHAAGDIRRKTQQRFAPSQVQNLAKRCKKAIQVLRKQFCLALQYSYVDSM